MSTHTVTETVYEPDHSTPSSGARVQVQLVASSTDRHAPGYVTGSDYTIGGPSLTTTTSAGVWSMTLEDNASITPANTAYRIDYKLPSGAKIGPVYITVTSSAATQRVEDILTTAPSSLATPLSVDPSATYTFASTDTTVASVISRIDGYARPSGPDAWGDELRTFKVAFSNRASARCNILVVGDSVSQGWTASSTGGRWFDVMIHKMQTAIGMSEAAGYAAVGTASAANAYTGKLWTASGSVTQNTDMGLAYSNMTITSAASVTLTSSSAGTFDRFWVHYPTFATLLGTLEVYLGDGAGVLQTTITTYTGTTLGGRVWDSGDLTSSAARTIRLESGNAYSTRAEGVTLFNGNYSSGIGGWNGGHFGYKYEDFASEGLSSWWTDGLDQIEPHLVIWACGINEQAAAVDAGELYTNFTTAKNRVDTVMSDAGFHAPSHLVIAPFGTGTTSTASDSYRRQAWRAGIDNGCAVVDWYDLMGWVGTSGADNSPVGFDLMTSADPADGKKHPNNKGHRFLGEQMANYLLRAVGYTT